MVQGPLHKPLLTRKCCAGGQSTPEVRAFRQTNDNEWRLHASSLRIGHKKVFAPANLRCANTNEAYRTLVDEWISQGYTLRYSGGMVPDVHHILTKVGLQIHVLSIDV